MVGLYRLLYNNQALLSGESLPKGKAPKVYGNFIVNLSGKRTGHNATSIFFFLKIFQEKQL